MYIAFFIMQVIKRKGLSLQFGIDKTCNFGTTDIIPQTEKYNLDHVPGMEQHNHIVLLKHYIKIKI